MDFQEKEGRWLETQFFASPIAPAVLPSDKSWGRTHTHTPPSPTPSQSVTPRQGNAASPTWNRSCLLQIQKSSPGSMGVGATCCSFSRAPRGSCSWKWTRPAAETLPFRLLRSFRFQHLPSGDLRLSLTGADLGAKECCFHCPTGLRGVYQVPSCHLWGRGVSSCLPGLVLHRGEKRPLAPFRIGYKETFARPPAPSSPGPSPPRRALPPAAGWRRGEGSRLALRAQGLAFPPGGEARSPPASPSHRAQPPGRSSPLCGRALPPLRGASRGRRHLEFCPKQGAWRRRRGEDRRRPAARTGTRSPARRGVEDRSGGCSSEGSGAAPPAHGASAWPP